MDLYDTSDSRRSGVYIHKFPFVIFWTCNWKRKANWIGHILRRNCLLEQVIEGKIKGEIEVARRQGRRRKTLLDDLKNRRGYCHLKGEAMDRSMWRDRFGRGFGPVVRQTTGWWQLFENTILCVCVCVCVCQRLTVKLRCRTTNNHN